VSLSACDFNEVYRLFRLFSLPAVRDAGETTAIKSFYRHFDDIHTLRALVTPRVACEQSHRRPAWTKARAYRLKYCYRPVEYMTTIYNSRTASRDREQKWVCTVCDFRSIGQTWESVLRNSVWARPKKHSRDTRKRSFRRGNIKQILTQTGIPRIRHQDATDPASLYRLLWIGS